MIWKVEMDHPGMDELLKSDGLRSVLEAEARNRNPGTGYEVRTYKTKSRVAAKIQTATEGGVKDNARHNTLLKALGGGEKK